MPLFPDDARANPGRAIPPAWRSLENWVDDFEPPMGGIHTRVTEWPDQTSYFTRRETPPPRFRFRCAVAGTSATVGMGFLNLETPRMGEELLTLDGLDKDGIDTGRIPELPLLFGEYGGPGRGTLISYIVLRVIVDAEAGEPALEAHPFEWLTVTHRPSLPPGFHAGGMPTKSEGDLEVALWPLAKLYWTADATSVARYFPVTMHNIQFRFERGTIDEGTGVRGPNRGWFFGVT